MQGRTCLLCTHNLAEAEALCDQMIILQKGHVIVQGRLEELRRGARPRVRLAARQGPEAVRARLGQVGPVHVDGTAAAA
jgi:ABC-2 type transport system ATP-binding protein